MFIGGGRGDCFCLSPKSRGAPFSFLLLIRAQRRRYGPRGQSESRRNSTRMWERSHATDPVRRGRLGRRSHGVRQPRPQQQASHERAAGSADVAAARSDGLPDGVGLAGSPSSPTSPPSFPNPRTPSGLNQPAASNPGMPLPAPNFPGAGGQTSNSTFAPRSQNMASAIATPPGSDLPTSRDAGRALERLRPGRQRATARRRPRTCRRRFRRPTRA